MFLHWHIHIRPHPNLKCPVILSLLRIWVTLSPSLPVIHRSPWHRDLELPILPVPLSHCWGAARAEKWDSWVLLWLKVKRNVLEIKWPKIISKEGFLKAETLGSGSVSLKAQSNPRWWAQDGWDRTQGSSLSPTVPRQLQKEQLLCLLLTSPASSPASQMRCNVTAPSQQALPSLAQVFCTVLRVQGRLPWERAKENIRNFLKNYCLWRFKQMQIIICSFWHGRKAFLPSVLQKHWSKTSFLLLLKARLVGYSFDTKHKEAR